MAKNKKEKYVDDGHTIYNMDIDGMPHRRIKNTNGVVLTKKERSAVIKAAILHFMPIVLGVIFCFFITFLLIYLWLK